MHFCYAHFACGMLSGRLEIGKVHLVKFTKKDADIFHDCWPSLGVLSSNTVGRAHGNVSAAGAMGRADAPRRLPLSLLAACFFELLLRPPRRPASFVSIPL